MHCGLGEQWTDHHTLALITAQDGKARFDHSAFEVLDLDDVMQGSEHLKARGYLWNGMAPEIQFTPFEYPMAGHSPIHMIYKYGGSWFSTLSQSDRMADT